MDDSTVGNAFESQIGKIVAFVLTPILAPLVGALAFWLQDKLGINMDPAVAVGYIVTVVSAVAVAAGTWLHNRGKWEATVAETAALHDMASAEVEKQSSQSPGAWSSSSGPVTATRAPSVPDPRSHEGTAHNG